ncbi:hypothetical protein CEXT_598231 [Caerostris extrusa]|uniref:Uncharacterized protein n=1 Tax=Caerostris extrusa TaxID=172846 RepID=A0AAV4Q824_CAEEX|nr:hypothetical protein CEXT_598231 [Caerostris extrusa]
MEDPCVYLRYFQRQQMSETRLKEIKTASRREGFCWIYMQKIMGDGMEARFVSMVLCCLYDFPVHDIFRDLLDVLLCTVKAHRNK